MNTGKYIRLHPDKLNNKHKKIVELKQQGLPLVKIAEQLNTTYGSVIYVLYRKPNQLWQ